MRALSFLIASTLTLGLTITKTYADEKAKPVSVKVKLVPMGSFEATADSVIGKGKKVGDKYTAKEVKVLINKLKTGMDLRDQHLRETLETEGKGKEKKFKFIVVENIQASKGVGQADITIKGIKKPVKFKFEDLGSKKAQAHFKLNIKDFGITGVNYGGVGVQDTIDVSAIIPYE